MSNSSDADSAPGFEAVTAANDAGWLIVASCTFLIFSVLALVAKLLISRSRSVAPGLYDAFLVAATLLAFAETVCVIFACKHGLGRHRAAVSDASFKLVSEFSYAASIIVVVSQASSKVSVALLLLVLSPYAVILNLCRVTITVVVLWVMSGVTAFAVQCRLPQPWISVAGACLDQRALFLYLGIVNIIIDVTLVLIPTYLMFITRSASRYEVIALFSTRMFVPGFVIASQVSMASIFSSPSPDTTRDAVLPTIWTQIALNLSIVAACIPGLKSILDAYRSDAAVVSIIPPYEVTVSGSRYPKWLESSILPFRSWLARRNPCESRKERHDQSSSVPSFVPQNIQSAPSQSGSDRGSSIVRSGSTTRLTTSVIDEPTDYRARAVNDEQSCNRRLPPEEEKVKTNLG